MDDEGLLIRQQWIDLQRDIDRYRFQSGVGVERTIRREELVTRLNDIRRRLVHYYSSSPNVMDELKSGPGLSSLEFVIRRIIDKYLPEEECKEHGRETTEGGTTPAK